MRTFWNSSQTSRGTPTNRANTETSRGAPRKYPRAMAMALDLLDKGEDKDVTIYRKCKAANSGEHIPANPDSFMRRVRAEAKRRREQT